MRNFGEEFDRNVKMRVWSYLITRKKEKWEERKHERRKEERN